MHMGKSGRYRGHGA